MASNDFHYNQKEVLLKHLSDHIEKFAPSSLLDIGAGDGKLALPLSKRVANYVAIELNHERAERLRKKGVIIIEGIFPFEVPGSYDLVLSIHSIPEKIEGVKPFLEAAWQLVNTHGVLLIVTFKGARGDLIKIKNEIDREWKDNEKQIFTRMIMTLKSFGVVHREQLTSTMCSPQLTDIIEVLSISLGIKKEEKERIEKLRHIINTRYKINNKIYCFPTPHLCVWVKKL